MEEDIAAANIVDGAITTNKLASGAVTVEKCSQGFKNAYCKLTRITAGLTPPLDYNNTNVFKVNTIVDNVGAGETVTTEQVGSCLYQTVLNSGTLKTDIT